MYEGAPTIPAPDRFWQHDREVRRHDLLHRADRDPHLHPPGATSIPKKHDLSSLRLLGTVGEPINPEAWMWYHRVIGGKRCPIVDTWWQTETGGIMITPLPGAVATKPGSATLPVPRHRRRRSSTTSGKPVKPPSGGFLVITQPWPGMLRGIWGDPRALRGAATGASATSTYFAGDGARRDKDGYFWIMGRIDDVINVSGHRLGTMEVESALVSHPQVAEAAVVGRPDDLKGTAIVAFVTPKRGDARRPPLARRAQAARREADRRDRASPTTSASPTRCRRRARARSCAACCATSPSGSETVGDTTTLEDYSVLAKLQEQREDA